MKILSKNLVLVVWGAATLHLPFRRNFFKLLVETAQNVMGRHRAVLKLATRNFAYLLCFLLCSVMSRVRNALCGSPESHLWFPRH